MAQTLNYVSPDDRYSRRAWPARLFGAAMVLLLSVLLVPCSPTVRKVESSVDAVTGTMTWKTAWIFGIAEAPRVDVSPLERRLKQIGVTWRPTPVFLHNTHVDAFGRACGWECGTAPPIYQLRILLKEFVAASTDDELRAFVRIMESGTEAEQRAAVDAAAEKALRTPVP